MNASAKIKITCTSSSLLLERILQITRYRGFQVKQLTFSELVNTTVVEMLVTGTAKFSTLEKSLMELVEVQECYMTEDQEKLAPSLEMGQNIRPNVNHSSAQQLS